MGLQDGTPVRRRAVAYTAVNLILTSEARH